MHYFIHLSLSYTTDQPVLVSDEPLLACNEWLRIRGASVRSMSRSPKHVPGGRCDEHVTVVEATKMIWVFGATNM